VLAGLEDKHPTLVFLADELEEVRRRIAEEQPQNLMTLRATVERAKGMGLPPAATFHLAPTEQQRKMYYLHHFREYRRFVDTNLVACSLYYLLTGDKQAGEWAKKLMLQICGMTPEGPNAVDGPWGDEPGLSHSRCLHDCYDWTYDLYDERERRFVENMLVIYCRQTYRRLLNDNYMERPASSHLGRLPGYLGEQAICLRKLVPEAPEMLQYVLDVLCTFYPTFGGVDGGWGQGVSYGLSYNRWYIPFFTTFYKLTGFSFWWKPFFRRVKEFFLYCCPTNCEQMPFGDGEERGMRNNPVRASMIRPLFQFYARWFNDARMLEAARRLPQPETFNFHMVEAFITPPDANAPAAVPDRRGPTSNSKLFRGIGWAALHGDLDHPERDNLLLFKSSPIGSFSHSHGDQNSFFVSSGGKALAICAGYYGPGWGGPHHVRYTQQTMAHNCILVDGEGQPVQDYSARGKILRFEDQAGWSYVCGDATQAYKGKLTKFLRHVLFVHPSVFLIYDELEAAREVTYSWLLHSLEAPEIDHDEVEIQVAHHGAHLRALVKASTPLRVACTDQFETPYNFGMMEEFHEERANQYHISLHSDKCRAARFGAVLVVWQDDEPPPKAEAVREGDLLRVKGETFSATMSLVPGAPDFRATIESKELDLLAWRNAGGG